MNDYLELADKLDQAVSPDDISLEKLASLYLLYEYSKVNGSLLDSPELVKEAERLYDEDSTAAYIGICRVLDSIEGLEG